MVQSLTSAPSHILSPWFKHPGMTDRLVELHRSAMGFTDIATTLEKEFGIPMTRSQCIGKARRLLLAPRDHNPRREKKEATATATATAKSAKSLPPELQIVTIAPPEPDPPDSMRPLRWRSDLKAMPVVQLRFGECKFPISDELPFEFCRRPQLESFPYCPEHCARCYHAGRS